mmetsp:Transcript_59611/g.194471  ORF Transcript_59611/g.194471 Transcript_59611/m.194471 type:complete len:241 (+) Transcript_59611:216-938(+)
MYTKWQLHRKPARTSILAQARPGAAALGIFFTSFAAAAVVLLPLEVPLPVLSIAGLKSATCLMPAISFKSLSLFFIGSLMRPSRPIGILRKCSGNSFGSFGTTTGTSAATRACSTLPLAISSEDPSVSALELEPSPSDTSCALPAATAAIASSTCAKTPVDFNTFDAGSFGSDISKAGASSTQVTFLSRFQPTPSPLKTRHLHRACDGGCLPRSPTRTYAKPVFLSFMLSLIFHAPFVAE